MLNPEPTTGLAQPTSRPIEPTAQLIPLQWVHPDPEQPRHLLPADLADALAAGSSPQEILTQLRARAERDQWARERLRELDALAQSIREDGLLQPIRVLPDGEHRYRIEEGERRWWAHHILVQQGRAEFGSIKAFVVERETAEGGVLRRRVAENMLRSGFTAIELARAMASRIQEILGAEPDTKRGDAERRVASENGMSDRRVRQFVALLTLSPEAQELAQQARLTENSLRAVLGMQDAARQLVAVREMMRPHPPKPKSRRNSPPTKRVPTTRNAIHKAHAQKRRVSARRPSASSREPIVHGLNRSTALRDLLKLARFFSGPESHLAITDWIRMLKTEADRERLEKLQAVLEEGLAATTRKSIDQGNPS